MVKRKRWDALLEAALSQCPDIEVPNDATAVGACVEAAMDWIGDLADTTRWSDFPVGNDTLRFTHDDGTVSVSKRSMRRVIQQRERDARRKDVSEALRVMGGTEHRLQGRGNTMYRVKLVDGK